MKYLDIGIIILIFLLIGLIAENPPEQKLFFDKSGSNQTIFDKISPKYTEIAGLEIEKPFYERIFEFIIIGPFHIFPNNRWLGPLLIYGGLYILWLKHDFFISKLKKKKISNQ
jgi:hypothetical protein